MPNPDDTARTRLRKATTPHEDWQADYQRITGVPYSLRDWLLRIHPDDVVHAIRELHRGALTGRIDMVYRMRDATGEYVRVRGSVRVMFNEWIGVIYCLGREDCATVPSISRYLVRRAKNALAPIAIALTAFDYMEWFFR